MEINRYIKDLLLEHDCVVIPGLGGFIGSPMGAEVQGVTKTISPPGKKISFNGQLQRNDGLLIHFISLSEGITYDEAEHAVLEFVKNSKTRLQQSGIIMFPEVGKLLTDNEGTISFHPTPGRNLLQDSFGLKPVHYRQIFDTVSEEPIEQTESAPLLVARKTPSKTRRLISAYGVSIAAMLVLGIFIGQGIYLKPLALENFGFFQPQKFWGNDTEAPSTKQSNIPAEPIAVGSLEVTGTLEIPAEEPIAPEAAPTEETTPVEEPTPAPIAETNTAAVPHITQINTNDIATGYYIVLGAYSSQKNANKFIKEQKSLAGLVVIPSNSLFRVALPVGDIAATAYQKLEKQRQQENPAAWLVYNQK